MNRTQPPIRQKKIGLQPLANRHLPHRALKSSPLIHQILVPVDAVHTKLSDFSPILLMARRLGAKVTLLHCYVAPPSFDHAVGDAALEELSLHCRLVRNRLYELASDARKLYFNCIGRFALGYPSVQILRQSRELKADLIAVPLPLDLISWCWLPEDLLDELVRKAECPLLCVPAVLGNSKVVGRGSPEGLKAQQRIPVSPP